VNSWLIEEWEFDSEERRENFLFYITSRLPLWFTQPLVQWVLESVSLFIMSPISEATHLLPSGARVTYAWKNTSCPHIFRGVVLSEAHGLSLYCNMVLVSMGNCTVLGTLEPHQWITLPSEYNLLHRLAGTHLLQFTVWLTLHLIWGQLPTPSTSISHPLITFTTGLPTGRDIIACDVKY